MAWVAQALVLRLMHAEKAWNHDAFFDYCRPLDVRERRRPSSRPSRRRPGKDHDKDWARQGQTWEPYVNELWFKYRPTLAAPTDGWKQPHDDSYYRHALEHPQK